MYMQMAALSLMMVPSGSTMEGTMPWGLTSFLYQSISSDVAVNGLNSMILKSSLMFSSEKKTETTLVGLSVNCLTRQVQNWKVLLSVPKKNNKKNPTNLFSCKIPAKTHNSFQDICNMLKIRINISTMKWVIYAGKCTFAFGLNSPFAWCFKFLKLKQRKETNLQLARQPWMIAGLCCDKSSPCLYQLVPCHLRASSPFSRYSCSRDHTPPKFLSLQLQQSPGRAQLAPRLQLQAALSRLLPLPPWQKNQCTELNNKGLVGNWCWRNIKQPDAFKHTQFATVSGTCLADEAQNV